MEHETSTWLSRQELAEYLSVDPDSVRRWRKAGTITGYRLPDTSTIRYRRREIDAALLPVDPEDG